MDISKDKVEALIQQGQKRGFTGKEVIDGLIRKGYKPEGVNVEAIKQKIEPVMETGQPSYFERIKEGVAEDINKRTERVSDIKSREDTGMIEKGAQILGQGAGLGADVIEKTVGEIPGVKQATEKIGEGIKWLSETKPFQFIGDKIGGTKAVQEAVSLYDTDANFRDTIDGVTNLVRLGMDVTPIVESPNFVKNVISKIETKIPATTGEVPPSGLGLYEKIGQAEGKVRETISTVPETIMNKVARLNPTDFQKFNKLTGKTPGQYLAEKGNFNAPDQIITQEAETFAKALADKEATLAKLPGVYKDASIDQALKELLSKAKETSSGQVKSPYLKQVQDFITKNKSEGLTMEEINQVKKLFESKVRLGYNKISTPSSTIEKATNIDNALRKFQDVKAKELGFKNIDEISKQIQASKFIVDKLGNKIIGQSGLNGVSLTDYVILAGGDPMAVGAFLTKKFFSNKNIQAKIAKLLSGGEVKAPVVPDYSPQATKAIQPKKTKINNNPISK